MVRKPPPRVRKRVSVTRGSLVAPPLFGGSLVAGLGPAPPVLRGGRTSLVGGMTGRAPPGQRASIASAMPGVIGPPTGRSSLLVGIKGMQLPPVVATQTTPASTASGADDSENDGTRLLPRVIGQMAGRGAVPLIEMSTLYAPRAGDGDSNEDD
jgi:hypothetical protein